MEEESEIFRHQMVREQIRSRGIWNSELLKVLERIPRHLFCPAASLKNAYSDYPLPIGEGQTISQPYIVALMTELLEIKSGSKILEIGTGSGYQTAILAALAGSVYTVERIEVLAERARKILDETGVQNVFYKTGDGFEGWPENAPFDGIIVTAAPRNIPSIFLEQLAPGGRLVIPAGTDSQILYRVIKNNDGTFDEAAVTAVRFVPLVEDQDFR